MTIILEIRPAEGGDHAKRIVHMQADIYKRWAERNDVSFLGASDGAGGALILRFRGESATRLLNESGGHRHQGYSKNRVHTSTVTVAAISQETPVTHYNRADVDVIRTKDSGKGGQHRNKTESAILLTHRPTGITAKSADRSQHQNLEAAHQELERRVISLQRKSWEERLNDLRRELIGSGQRGDKIRTYRERDNVVLDHRTNVKMSFQDILHGKLPI